MCGGAKVVEGVFICILGRFGEVRVCAGCMRQDDGHDIVVELQEVLVEDKVLADLLKAIKHAVEEDFLSNLTRETQEGRGLFDCHRAWCCLLVDCTGHATEYRRLTAQQDWWSG